MTTHLTVCWRPNFALHTPDVRLPVLALPPPGPGRLVPASAPPQWRGSAQHPDRNTIFWHVCILIFTIYLEKVLTALSPTWKRLPYYLPYYRHSTVDYDVWELKSSIYVGPFKKENALFSEDCECQCWENLMSKWFNTLLQAAPRTVSAPGRS